MSVFSKVRRAVRGEVTVTTAALEVVRRSYASLSAWRELSSLNHIGNRPARLQRSFSEMPAKKLLAHFRTRVKPRFFTGFSQTTGDLQQKLFPAQTLELLRTATGIRDQHCWPLLGYKERFFGDEIEWCRDPISGYVSPLVYHRNVRVLRSDGSDVRVLWELNRFVHSILLARAYAVQNDEAYAREFFKQTYGWSLQNPFGQGPNWHCAMEVALRAMNLLASFELFRRSSQLSPDTLFHLLKMFDQHGTYIQRNLEFSYVATSNHYLTDVVGLLWLGILLPELSTATEWRELGLREMLHEIDKQILLDGADYESSTGYHRFVVELLLYSFLLCRLNDIEIPQEYWSKLRLMLEYLKCYLRPDGWAPLIGDSDSGQVLPIRHRQANDHAYLLAIGAVALNDSSLKIQGLVVPEELLWFFGEEGVSKYESLPSNGQRLSISFPHAGVHVLRQNDLYLCFNTSGAGINGRGSHGHNDVLSIEVAACGRSFIVDPGTYVYTGDLSDRHRFRSTAYHSTVQVSGEEQATININVPFAIGDEPKPRLLQWETNAKFDRVCAEHYGYTRLQNPLTHRRTVTLNKAYRCWVIDDEFLGTGTNELGIRFHFDAGLVVEAGDDKLTATDNSSGAKLLILAMTLRMKPFLEIQAISYDYGNRQESIAGCWRTTSRSTPLSWLIIPVCPGENELERLQTCNNSAFWPSFHYAVS